MTVLNRRACRAHIGQQAAHRPCAQDTPAQAYGGGDKVCDADADLDTAVTEVEADHDDARRLQPHAQQRAADSRLHGRAQPRSFPGEHEREVKIAKVVRTSRDAAS